MRFFKVIDLGCGVNKKTEMLEKVAVQWRTQALLKILIIQVSTKHPQFKLRNRPERD